MSSTRKTPHPSSTKTCGLRQAAVAAAEVAEAAEVVEAAAEAAAAAAAGAAADAGEAVVAVAVCRGAVVATVRLEHSPVALAGFEDVQPGQRPSVAASHANLKKWYSISRTISDDYGHHDATDDRSVRAFAVKPRAFGAPLRGVGA